MIVASGHVSERPFARTIYAIGSRRLTGDLVLYEGGKRYTLGWENGEVVAAESASPTDSAGRIAIAAGMVTTTMVGQSLSRMAQRPGVDQLDILIELARLGPESVAALRRRILVYRAARAFALADARFELTDGRATPREPVEPLDARWLINFGLRTHYGDERLERELGSLHGRAVRLADDALPVLGAFGFADTDQPILVNLRRKILTTDELCAAIPGLERRVILAVVYALAACDCLTINPQAVSSVLQAVDAGTVPVMEPSQPNLRVSQKMPMTLAQIGAQNRVRRLTGQPPLTAEQTRPRATVPPGGRPTTEPPPNHATGPQPALSSSQPIALTFEPTPVHTTQPLDLMLPPKEPTQPTIRTSHAQPAIRVSQSQPALGLSQPIPAQPSARPVVTPAPARPATVSTPPPTAAGPLPTPPAARPATPSTPPPTAAATRPGADAGELRDLIKAKVAELDGKASHYAVLGVPQTATVDAVRTAYFGLAKRLHPDRLRAAGIHDLQADAQRLFAGINAAFATLSDAARRNQYNTVLASGGAEAARKAEVEAEQLANKLFRAEEAFQKGEMALRRNQFEQARQHFALAVELAPDEAEHQALLAWATWVAGENKAGIYAEVQRRLNQAITTSARCVPAHFYRGMVAKQAGKDDVALESFRRVLEIKPSHPEAGLELRLLESRRLKKKDTAPGGLFDRLKKK